MSSTDPLSGAFAERRAGTEERYEVLAVVATGGMGSVVRARDHRVGRDVAIKRALADVPGAEARLRREAILLARLHHPGVVTLLDAGEDPRGFRLVLPWIEGRGLEEVLGTPSGMRALADVAEALAAAHEWGIVHRDVKPSNILMADHGAVLVDWGLGWVDEPAAAGTCPPLTRTGTVVGTPGYIAPEQSIGADAAPTADVWAFGILLYRQLTRRPAPDAEAVWAGLPLEHLPTGPLGDLARACLARAPQDRLPDGGAIREALQEALSPPRSRRPRAPLAVGVLVAVGLAGLGLASRQPADVARVRGVGEDALLELAWTAHAEGRGADAQAWAAALPRPSAARAGLDWLPPVPEAVPGLLLSACDRVDITPQLDAIVCADRSAVKKIDRMTGALRWELELPEGEAWATDGGTMVRDQTRLLLVDDQGRQTRVAHMSPDLAASWHAPHLAVWSGAKVGVGRFANTSLSLSDELPIPVRTPPVWDPRREAWMAGLFHEIVWMDPDAGDLLERTPAFTDEDLIALQVLPDGILAVGCRGQLTTLDADGRVVRQRRLGDGGFVLGVSLTDTHVALQTAQTGVTVWDVASGGLLGQLVERDRSVRALRLGEETVVWVEGEQVFSRPLPERIVDVHVPGLSALGGEGAHWAAAGQERLVELTPPYEVLDLTPDHITKDLAWWDDAWVVANPAQVEQVTRDGRTSLVRRSHRGVLPLADGSLLTVPYGSGPFRLVGDQVDRSLARMENFVAADGNAARDRVGLVTSTGRIYQIVVADEGVELTFVAEHPGARHALPVGDDGMWVTGRSETVWIGPGDEGASWTAPRPITAVAEVGERCFFGDDRGRIEVRDCRTGALEAVLRAHEERVVAMEMRAGALWTASWDEHVRRFRLP